MSRSKKVTPFDQFDGEPTWADEEFDFRTAPGKVSDQTRPSDIAGFVLFFVFLALLKVAGYGELGPQLMALLVFGVLSTLWARLRYWAVHRISGNAHVVSFAKSYTTHEWRRRSFRWDDVVGIEAVMTKTFASQTEDFADIAILTKGKRTLLGMQLLPTEADDLVAVLVDMSRHARMSRAGQGGYRGVRVNEVRVSEVRVNEVRVNEGKLESEEAVSAVAVSAKRKERKR
ncbi:MAG: hypothetical protein AB8H86_13735 [Polyangiales bacterium]